MADNVAITAGSGTPIATDDISGVHYQKIKLFDGTSDSAAAIAGDATNGLDVDVTRIVPGTGATNLGKAEDGASANADVGIAALAVRKATPANTSDTDGDYEFLQMSAGRLWASSDLTLGGTAVDGNSGNKSAGTLRVVLATDQPAMTNAQPVSGNFVTCSTDVTRPADTTAYAVNDAISDSTSSPTSGGYTFTSAARASGGSGIITDAIITTSADAGTLLQGEIWLFNTSVTNINDNAAFAVSDAEIKTCVGKIPFTLEDAGNNGFFHATNLNIGFTCSGSANLRYLLKAKNAYTPASAEVITCVIKVLQVT